MANNTHIQKWNIQLMLLGGITLIVLFGMPSHSASSLLLGFSKIRWMEIVGVIVVVAFSVGSAYIWPGKTEGFLRWVSRRPAALIFLELVGFILTVSLIGGILWGGMALLSPDSERQLLISRAAPVVIFVWGAFLITIFHFAESFYSLPRPMRRYFGLYSFRKVLLNPLFGKVWLAFERFDRGVRRTAEQIHPGWIGAFLVVLPAVGTFLLLRVVLHSGPQDYFPVRYDDVDYWREIYSFAAHGFHSGQYSINENTAPLEFFRFGPHGPGFPVFYGLIGRMIGWQSSTGVWINLVLITLAVGGFLMIVRPDRKQLLVLAVFLMTYWPIWLYIPRNMQEMVHLSFGILLAAFWIRQLDKKGRTSKWLWLMFLTIGFLSLIRFTWAILFVGPLVLLWQAHKEFLWLRWVLAASAFLASGLLFVNWSVPWVTFSFHFLETLQVAPLEALVDLLQKMGTNLSNLLYAPDDGGYVVVFRYQMVVMTAFLVYLAVKTRKQKDAIANRQAWNIGAVVVPIFLFVVALNDVVDTRDYRNLAPHFLMAVLLLILFNRHRFVYLMVFLNLVAIGSFGQRYANYQNAYPAAGPRVSAQNFAEATADVLVYDSVGNRWCNSLLVDYQGAVSQTLFSQVDPGIGIGVVKDWDLLVDQGLKSKYVFVDPVIVEDSHPGLLDSFSLEPLMEFSNGILYKNTRSACE